MNKLRPCPFCGTIPEVSKYGICIGQDAARCENVNCSMHTAGFIYLETWNTRPLEDALRKRAEAAVARIVELERTIGEATAPYISRKPVPDEWPSLVRMCAEGWEAMDRVAELEAEIKRLHAALDITNRILDGTGHSIQIDERGRYYIHSNDCDHYPLPDVVKDGEK